MIERREVVVAGGGPAGTAAAIFLRQRGHDVVLVDSARFPRDKVCGESVSPEAWRLLAAIGAADSVRSLQPRPIRGMTLCSANGSSFRGDYRDGHCGFALRRQTLDLALLGAATAAGVEVRQAVRVVDILRSDGTVSGVACDGPAGPHPIAARLVVGAEGRRSVVARRLGLLREHPSLSRFAVRGYYDGVEALEERGEMHVVRGAYCGVAPLSPTTANVAFVLDRREMAAAAGDLEGFYRRTLRRWPRLHERLASARLLAPPHAIGPLALQSSGTSAPGALLVGDSAGFYDPFTGEGITLALRSAELAAETADRALQHGACGDLRAYDLARHAATRDKFLFNRLLQRVIAWPELGDAVARRLARRPDLADRLVGIAGDFVPARTAFGPQFLWDLFRA